MFLAFVLLKMCFFQRRSQNLRIHSAGGHAGLNVVDGEAHPQGFARTFSSRGGPPGPYRETGQLLAETTDVLRLT